MCSLCLLCLYLALGTRTPVAHWAEEETVLEWKVRLKDDAADDDSRDHIPPGRPDTKKRRAAVFVLPVRVTADGEGSQKFGVVVRGEREGLAPQHVRLRLETNGADAFGKGDLDRPASTAADTALTIEVESVVLVRIQQPGSSQEVTEDIHALVQPPPLSYGERESNHVVGCQYDVRRGQKIDVCLMHQGTFIADKTEKQIEGTIVGKDFDPKKLISYIHNEKFTLTEQRREIDLLESLDRLQLGKETVRDPQLEAAIQSMEVAYRMQTEAPEVFDIRKETKATLDLYGPGSTARGCLMAVRLAEKGVRMVQVYYAKGDPWDAHSDIQAHRKNAKDSDQPFAAVIKDLKSRGLFKDTLVVCGSEFGRTPVMV